MSACLIERVADKLIKSSNSCQGKRLKSVLVVQVHSESRTMITDRLMRNQANEHSEAILPRKFQSSYSSVVEFPIQNELGTSVLSLLPQRSLYSTTWEKLEVKFYIVGNPTESENWSTKVIRQSSIQSPKTRRE